jgi:hypothetical protein
MCLRSTQVFAGTREEEDTYEEEEDTCEEESLQGPIICMSQETHYSAQVFMFEILSTGFYV